NMQLHSYPTRRSSDLESKKEIINTRDRSKRKAVSNEASNLEGYQFSLAVIDEFHEAVNRKMFETLRRGQVLLNNPGLHIISTAGDRKSTRLNSSHVSI